MFRKFRVLRCVFPVDALVVSAVVGGIICILRVVGAFQGLEWAQLDWLFRARLIVGSSEATDERIVIVGQTEQDIRESGETILSDRSLVRLLDEILEQEPRAIGLDLIRDQPEDGWGQKPQEAEHAYSQLQQLLARTPNLYIAAKLAGEESQRIPAPPEVPLKQVGDISLRNRDGVLRRKIFFATKRNQNGDVEEFVESFSVRLALAYLIPFEGFKEEDIEWQTDRWGRGIYRIGRSRFIMFPSYLGLEVLMNWRTPPTTFSTVSVNEVLNGKVEPNFFKDRIVLIGSMARSKQDLHYTGFSPTIKERSDELYGVETIANLTSQIISSVLDERPNLETLPERIEYVLIFLAGFSACLIRLCHKRNQGRLLSAKVVIIGGVGVAIALIISYTAFLEGFWLPFIPFTLAFLGGTIVQPYVIYEQERRGREAWKDHKLAKIEAENERMYEIMLVLERQDAVKIIGGKIIDEVRVALNKINRGRKVCLDSCKQFKKFLPEDTDIQQLVNNLTYMEKDLEKSTFFLEEVFYSIKLNDSVPAPVQINNLLDSIIERVKRQFSDPDVDLENLVEINFDPTLEEIEVLPFSLRHALTKLLDRAFDKALNKPRERRTGRKQKPKVIVETKNDEHEIVISIADNGKNLNCESCSGVENLLVARAFDGQEISGWLVLVYESIFGFHKGRLNLVREAGFTKFVIHLPKKFRDKTPLAIDI